MAIVVLPRIEQPNPFGELAEVIGEQALPYLVKLYANKDKIAKLSDTELTDFVEVLQRYAPELVSGGKINWDKVNEWAQSDDQTKLQVASFLFDAKRVREDFANAPLIAKLQAIDVAGSINPQELNKIFVAGKMQQKLAEAIGNSNLPDEYKLLFLANIEKFAEKPHLIPILEKVLGGTMQAGNTGGTKDSGGGTGSWQFSLDGSKPFGIQLEEPILTPPQISPPQMPVAEQKPVVGQGGGETEQRPAGGTKKAKQNQQRKDQKPQPQAFWRDGVLWEPRVREDGKIEYVPRNAPLIEQSPFDLVVGGVVGKLLSLPSKAGGFFGRVFGKKGVEKAGKEAQQVAENVAKKEAQNIASNQAQNVVRQPSKQEELLKRAEKLEQEFQQILDKIRGEKRRIVEEKIKEEMKRNRGDFTFAEKPKQINPEEVRATIKEAWKKNKEKLEQERQSRLPVPAPKETRWEFANAKPPALVFREGKMVDYTPPQFERIPITKYLEYIRQSRLPVEAQRYKESTEQILKESYKAKQQLTDFLKKEPTYKVNPQDFMLQPFRRLTKLVNETPDWVKNTPQFKQIIKELVDDMKRIQNEVLRRDVSKDLMDLNKKIDKLENLLNSPTFKSKVKVVKKNEPAKKETPPQQKKSTTKSNKKNKPKR